MRAVCFDLDDTLGRYASDFSAFLALVRNELALHQCDMNAFARLVSEEMRRDGPLTFELVLRRVLERLQQRPPADLAALTRAALAMYAADYRPLPGAAELLDRLDAAGVKLALLTNGPDDMQRAALAALGFEGHFRAVLVSGDRDVAARKPAPRIFSLACTALEVTPEEAVMVGDDLDADVAGALDFGMGAVLVGPLAEAGGGAAPSAPALWRARDLAEVGRLLAEPSRMAP
ncbi:MAG: HAD family hydrolase [Trueperaceae bacterium]|nr:HAD family hydrolase [Trueperaceae bacterium]